MISNGNRTEWSPIRSAIIRVINKITSMMACYQLIITITISVKQKVFIGKKLLIAIFQNSNISKFKYSLVFNTISLSRSKTRTFAIWY